MKRFKIWSDVVTPVAASQESSSPVLNLLKHTLLRFRTTNQKRVVAVKSRENECMEQLSQGRFRQKSLHPGNTAEVK